MNTTPEKDLNNINLMNLPEMDFKITIIKCSGDTEKYSRTYERTLVGDAIIEENNGGY